MHDRYARIYTVVAMIPRGRVATYGQVARLAGLPGHARQIGYALAALGEGATVPWHRVVNSRGEISPRRQPDAESRQRAALEDEGILFDPRGRISLAAYRWTPEAD
jgi:methylated-DNA-protein-cysteine methyltransferase related protein